MRKLIVLVAFSVVFSGYIEAQQATGPAAEEAKKEIIQIEKAKVPLILKGGNAFADWLYKNNAEDALFIGTDYRRSKAKEVALWRSGTITQFVHNEDDYHVYVYDNGNLAVVTYMVTTHQTVNGRSYRNTDACEDSWVKQDGNWLRVVHFTAHPAPGSKDSAE